MMFIKTLCLSILLFSFKNESQVLKTAKEENRPIVAAFLSANCPWSVKLNDEVLENPQFLEKVTEPLLWKCQDKELLQKYKVAASPVLVLLDPKGKEFARTEYVPLDAAGYAEMVNGYIESFQEICIALEGNVFEEERWHSLYEKSKKLSSDCFKQVLLEQGLRKEEGSFFHQEKFSALLEKHKASHPQVIKAKKKWIERDAEAQFKIAVLEFKKLSGKKSKSRPEKALIPLMRYVQKQGKKDQENLWKCELLIAEYLYTHHHAAPAVEHAVIALAAAPEEAKAQVRESLAIMKGGKHE